jgi:hypothetical protein
LTNENIAPVVVGLGVGIAFLIMFAIMMDESSQPNQQLTVATELPQVKLVVFDEQRSSYSGERGTYCWHNFGCADSGIIIPSKSINLVRNSIIGFEYLDSYHDNKAPNELAVVAFDLYRDLDVIAATKGRAGGDVEIATFDLGSRPIPYLSDIGNRKYSLDLAEGEYIIWTHSAWHLGDNIGDGDVSYFYRVSVS